MSRTTEEPIAFESGGISLNGVLHAPAGRRSYPAMVLFHGYFQSNRIGPLSLYVQLARSLASVGIGCLRFDAAGFGESHGNYADVTYETLVQDLNSAVKVLAQVRGLDPSKIGILGHSLGANIAIEVASATELVACLCLLSPNPTRIPAESAIFSSAQLEELEARGSTLRKGIFASQNVYGPINGGVTFRKAALVRAPSLLLFGDADPYYTEAQYLLLAEALHSPEPVVSISGADHNFLPVPCRAQLLERLLSWLTATFDMQ